MSRIVLIAGGTASGKSTIAEVAAQRLDALLISHDRYYNDVDDPRTHNYDHPDSLDTRLLSVHLALLARGQPADLPVYDFPSHRRTDAVERVQPRATVLVDGILVLADPSLRALASSGVFVDCPADIRLVRRLRRDLVKRGRSTESILDQYVGTVRPMHEQFVEPSRAFAQLVLDGEAAVETSVERLVSYLGSV